jgi:methionyl aminopeptidase
MSKKIIYKTDEEVALMRQSCLLVSKTLAYCGEILKSGMTGLELDKAAETFIRDNGGIPVFKGYRGFPGTLCISLNESVVHGIPNKTPFKDGDVVSIDCGTYLHNFVGDSAYTFAIGNVSPAVIKLLETTNESLYKGIQKAVIGMRIGDISAAIQDFCEKEHGYGVVRELVGHGVGRDLHEAPEVPNFGRKGNGLLLQNGLVIAIEPMVNMGTRNVKQHRDGWTITTADNKPSAHFEHTVCVRAKQADILTDHSFVEKAVENNAELAKISKKSTTFAL